MPPGLTLQDLAWLALRPATPTPPTQAALWVMGRNNGGQLGQNDTTDRSSPVQAGVGNYWISVSNYDRTLAIRADGTLWAWGWNNNGLLGLGDTANRSSPVQIGTGNTWSTASVTFGNSSALTSDGKLYVWGAGANGSIGDGSAVNRSSPVQIGADKTWARLANTQGAGAEVVGGAPILVMDSSNNLWGWGYNGYGILGQSDVANRSSPVLIGSNFKSVYFGYTNWWGVKYDGTLWACGDNTYGQLGDGTVTHRSSPVQIGAQTYWDSVPASDIRRAFFKTNTDSIYAVGSNQYGQLGDSTIVNRSSPVLVATGVSSMGYGVNSVSYFLKTDGSLWTCGYGGYGQLGLGDVANRSSPVQLAGTWAFAREQGDGAFFIKTDGTLWTVGTSYYGGLGFTTARSSPVQIGANTDWISIPRNDRSDNTEVNVVYSRAAV